MTIYHVKNLTRNPFKIPYGKQTLKVLPATVVQPNEVAEIDSDLHKELMAGNKAYRSLVEQDKLRVTERKDARAFDPEALETVADPQMPEDLKPSEEDRVKRTSKKSKVEAEVKTSTAPPKKR